jgi:hypothetical protein
VGTKRGSMVGTRWPWRRTRGMSTSDIEKSHGGGGGANEMNVEVEGDREGSDVTHPRGPRFAREEREGIGGGNEKKSLTGCKGMEVDIQTVIAQERHTDRDHNMEVDMQTVITQENSPV